MSRRPLTVLAAVLLPLLLSPAAQAQSRTFDDPTGDVRQGVDLQEVTVTYGEKWLKIHTQHRNLVPMPRFSAGMSVFLDTDPADAGPELRFGAGLMDGTDYALATTDGFAPSKDGKFVRCDYRMRIDYDTDVVKIRMSPDCVDDVASVRVAVKVAAEQRDVRSYDWLGAKRTFTEAIARG